MIEELNVRIELVGEPGLHALENVIRGCFVPRKAEGAVASVVLGDVVEMPEISLESGFLSVRM